MKFESKFGIGEICTYGEDVFKKARSENVAPHSSDHFAKVLAVNFEESGISYTCEISTIYGVQRIQLTESSLKGDPDFDRELGYPEEE